MILSIHLDILYNVYGNDFLQVDVTFSKIFHLYFPFSAHHLVRRDCISAIEINYFMVDQVCMSGKFYNCWCVSRNHLKIFVTFQKVTAEDFCAFVIDISVIVPSLSSSLRLPWSFLSFGLLWILSFYHSYQCPWQNNMATKNQRSLSMEMIFLVWVSIFFRRHRIVVQMWKQK